MRSLLKRLWNDDAGVIISIELLFLFVILILGLIAGWTNLRAAINSELTETANALLSLDQGYGITGAQGCDTDNYSTGSRATDVDQRILWSTLVDQSAASIDIPPCP
jgi:Flp pilus assembly pilin Flp